MSHFLYFTHCLQFSSIFCSTCYNFIYFNCQVVFYSMDVYYSSVDKYLDSFNFLPIMIIADMNTSHSVSYCVFSFCTLRSHFITAKIWVRDLTHCTVWDCNYLIVTICTEGEMTDTLQHILKKEYYGHNKPLTDEAVVGRSWEMRSSQSLILHWCPPVLPHPQTTQRV